jgi:AcrR family transcriptional regulator
VDRIVAEAGVAKTTLYRHFRSKDDLIAEVLKRHHQLWLRAWLEPEIYARGAGPAERLLAVFESFEKWFGESDFRGCLFINSLTETHDRSSAVGRVAVGAIEDVYIVLERLSVEAGVSEPSRLARQIHLLVRGCIIAAVEGRPDAVTEAQAAARHLVEQALPQA